ncbi:hypothetical protein HPB50_007149 [Hyalomma asiaticum]|uniref:Uncharacterized protein n=1 Tax=Hyalomma asiaticum TaxID=266040 RepID=A0ACB7RMV8_HYAAI|nr:hypothetical protein HPB50_007149 [Hyalomma asiaticum]
MLVSHCRRVCKILRSECWRQSRFPKDCLRAACSTCGDSRNDRRLYRVWYDSAVNVTEVLWRQVWVVLHKKQKNAGEPGKLLVLGDTQVDEEQKDILKLGPKLCVEPSLQLPDRLALARDISRNSVKECIERDNDEASFRNSSGRYHSGGHEVYCLCFWTSLGGVAVYNPLHRYSEREARALRKMLGGDPGRYCWGEYDDL